MERDICPLRRVIDELKCDVRRIREEDGLSYVSIAVYSGVNTNTLMAFIRDANTSTIAWNKIADYVHAYKKGE